MKIFLDKETSDYLEVKDDSRGNVSLSIRTKKDEKSSLIITAKLNPDIVEKLIANLIILKSKV